MVFFVIFSRRMKSIGLGDMISKMSIHTSVSAQPTLLPKGPQTVVQVGRKRVRFSFDQTCWDPICSWKEEKGLSIESVLISVWAVLLWRYNDTKRLLFVARLNEKGPVFIQLEMNPDTSVGDVFEQVQKCLDRNREVRNVKDDAFDHLVHISQERVQLPEMFSDLPFVIQLRWGAGLEGDIHYATDHFSPDFIQQIPIHLKNILNDMILYSNRKLLMIEVLSKEEQDQILNQWNQTQYDYPLEKTVDQLFVEQAIREPQKAAIVDRTEVWTYDQLHRTSNQLAHYLRKLGVNRGQTVGLLLDQSPWLMVGILGVIKAGAAYLPIDPHYPLKRVDYILQDSRIDVCLTRSGIETPKGYPGQLIHLDETDLSRESSATPERTHQLDDPVYVIYTSGSTGYPKGVVVEHRALLNLVYWHCRDYRVTPEDVSTKYAGVGFDASVWEVFPYLAAGATIHIIPEEIRFDVEALHRYYEQHHVTVSFLPTPIAEQFMKRDNASLRLLLTGGEQLRQVTGQSYRVANNYGPTENTVVTTSCFVDGQDAVISIGKPIANNQVLIINRFGQLQPMGVPGELCISGVSLARGYLNQPELTRQKFVDHPFWKGQRMYRTGDLARWLPDGRIEYLGRIDQQVKIRGYRIELGEIEATLLRHQQVKEAAVTVREDQQGEPVLCAYFVSKDAECSISDLQTYLNSELPDYMIPTNWMKIDRIPLTQHGKIDRSALPEIPNAHPTTTLSVDHLSPVERKLYQIWKDVLGVPPVTQEDHFFHTGGHSLKAMQLLTRIKQDVEIQIAWTDLFSHPTFGKLTEFLRQAKTVQYDSIERVATDGPFPPSPIQKQLFALEETRELGTTYHTPVVWLIKGKLDIERLKQTLQSFINRHEALRTTFSYLDGELKQQVHDQVDWKLEMFEANDEDEARKKVSKFIQPFQLHQSPLFRVGLIRISPNKHVLVIDLHHLICDGVSMGIFHREFEQLYRGQELPDLTYQYKDYAIWSQEQLTTKPLQQDERYWLGQFQQGVPKLQLPTDFQRPAQQQFQGRTVRFSLDADLTKQLREFSHHRNVTLYMMLLSVYSLLLAKITDQESFLVGSMVAGRSRKEWESVFGMFVNSLPIPIHPKREWPFEQFLQDVKQQVLLAQEHSHYPFAKLVEKLGMAWDHSRNPLFDTVFVMQNMEIPQVMITGLEIETFPYENKHAMFDLTWEVVERKKLEFSVEYNTDLFQEQTIERMINHYQHLLRQVIAEPQKILADFELITPEEKERILTQFNQPTSSMSQKQNVLELFARQVRETPNQIAIVSGDQSMTYQELEHESNRLAHLLQRKGVEAEKIVAVLVDNSMEYIISLFAILKAGGAFLPIDPAYPTKRIQYLLKDSGSSLVLVQKGIELPTWDQPETLYLDRRLWSKESSYPVTADVKKHHLAYVIYTSGSTGKPKGVMIEHRSLLNLVLWHHEYYQISSCDRSTKYAGVGFDASVWEIFPYLTKGASIYVVDANARHDVVALNQFFEKHRITVSFLPTAIAESFMRLKNSSLRLLLVGGDRLKRIEKTQYTVVNNYGPTENTVVTTCYAFETHDLPVLPIGRPIRNQQVYILNRDMQLQPIGVPGELCISGEGLARGYLGRPQLTKEKFCSHPLDQKKRIYRTGDLARWLPDGNIEYLGRLDDQVQIRGYRIELGEIESVLMEHPRVQEAVVLVHSQGEEKVLCAYFTGEREDLQAELRNYLKKELPDYMVPAYLIQLDALPLTENGKVDRKALPLPDRENMLDTTYQPPTNPTEQLLVKIWKEVLQHNRIGVLDNFFSLGGDSIKAIQVAARLQQYGKKMNVHQLYQSPTIQELAVYVEDHGAHISQEPIVGEVPLTPIQKYFFAQPFTDKHHWNQAVIISNQHPWEIDAVKKAFQQLVSHHDVLRVRYIEKKHGKVEQIIGEVDENHFTVEWYRFDCENELDEKGKDIAQRLQRSLHLSQGPLIRLAIFEADQRHELLVIVHHLLIDGVSWRILLDDFLHLYHGYVRKEIRSLPPKTTSYQLWSKKLVEYADSSEILREIPYWEAMEKKGNCPLFRANQVLPKGRLKDSDMIQFCLTKEQTKWLLENVHQAYHTEINDLLLAGLCLAVREWAQVDRLAIHLEGHGREAIFDEVDLSRTVGWFTTIYPVVFDLVSSSIPLMIKSVKETLRSIPNRGMGYGVLRYLTNPKKRENLQFTIQPEISFNYLGQFSEELCFAGIGSEGQPMMGDSFSSDSFIHPLEIYGAVLKEQMHFRFLYLRSTGERAQMQRLVDLYHHFLVQMIHHCMEKKDPSWTPSDFSASDISLEELDQFLQGLD